MKRINWRKLKGQALQNLYIDCCINLGLLGYGVPDRPVLGFVKRIPMHGLYAKVGDESVILIRKAVIKDWNTLRKVIYHELVHAYLDQNGVVTEGLADHDGPYEDIAAAVENRLGIDIRPS